MNVSQIIEILEKRVAYLQSLKAAAYAEGNLELYNKFDLEISETESALAILKPHV